jgi:hypothetical protein
MSWADILLASWLVIYGLLAVTNFSFELAPVILGLLAIAAGIVRFLKK